MKEAEKALVRFRKGQIPHEVPYRIVKAILLMYFSEDQLVFKGDDLRIHDARLIGWVNHPGNCLVIPVRKGRVVIWEYIKKRLVPVIEYLEEYENEKRGG